MGGNVTATNKKTGQNLNAEKIDLSKAGRQNFVRTITELFKELNYLYETKHNKKLWVNESKLDTNELYNGSTSFIMNNSISDEELLEHKSSAGDIDIIVPEESKTDLWELLDELEGSKITENITYHGSNKATISSIGEQINSLFIIEFDNYTALAQVDFEFLSVNEDGSPNEMGKFGHSSSFLDTKNNIKAVHHKYLIFALSGSIDVRENIATATKKSTPENIKISSAKGSDVARMLKFNLNKGISLGYERMKNTTGVDFLHEGKEVYREIPTAERTYINTVKEMSSLCVGTEIESIDENKFWSFMGILELIKENVTTDKLDKIHDRYFDKLFALKGQPGQVLEVGNKELDYEVKIQGYNKFCSELGLTPRISEIELYYSKFSTLRGGKLRETFRDYLSTLQNNK